ncbi:MAG: hypothetical protein CMP12_18575 [Zunongwangia sp.]|uniref:discoidin domain-containing protein n=1 Tax=Zunongwangia TaxID=417127 RepID=UPI000C63148D|nr:discoidin domain-containing protein [Zunongwangia profunda]MAB91459.1 hypothetical protein [Planctomycetota bacterium]MAO37877.1 hypothetical protein [Zunongwangia sp.]MAS71774.1 hypothetical protein [Zunongwangia sp.]|tara:strand:- start:2033 stop:3427 length:1395 start_codon:yes stop_codon:yes gene_type:complete
MKNITYKILMLVFIFIGFISCESDDDSAIDGLPSAIVNTDGPNAPARFLDREWFGNSEYLHRQSLNNNVAVYYGESVDRDIEWPFEFTESVWNFALDQYGDFGDNYLYAIYRTDNTEISNYLTYLDSPVESSVLDITLSGLEQNQATMAEIISEIGKIVEHSSNGVNDSPGEEVLKQEFNKIFVYDAFMQLGYETEAAAIKESYLQTSVGGIYWFRDWWLPLYEENGGGDFLSSFLRLVSQNYARKGDGYQIPLNAGGLIHFLSGTAGEDLYPLASDVLNIDNNDIFDLALSQAYYPNLAYQFEPLAEFVDITNNASISVSHENRGGADAGEGSKKLIDGNYGSKYLSFDGKEIIEGDFWLQQEIEEPTVLNRYILVSGNDAPGRDPSAWTISGSNDGVTWDVIDERADEKFTARGQERKFFIFNNSTPYKYYRMNITGYGEVGLFQMAEWRLETLVLLADLGM